MHVALAIGLVMELVMVIETVMPLHQNAGANAAHNNKTNQAMSMRHELTYQSDGMWWL